MMGPECVAGIAGGAGRLVDRLEVVETDQGAWRGLARFHYRQGRPGAVERVFALRWRRDERSEAWRALTGEQKDAVGVIVYSMPVRQVALRNAATGGRYVGLPGPEAVRLLNREVRCISRVVIHPRLRGVGLGWRLVAQTLEAAGTELVEAMAAMGRVNPFFERAGMVRYEGAEPAYVARLRGALEAAGVEEKAIVRRGGLEEEMKRLGESERRLVEAEVGRFVGACVRGGKDAVCSPEGLGWLMAEHLWSRPVYYLWRRGWGQEKVKHFLWATE